MQARVSVGNGLSRVRCGCSLNQRRTGIARNVRFGSLGKQMHTRRFDFRYLFPASRLASVLQLEQLQTLHVGGILLQDLVAFCLSLIGSYVWVKLFGIISDRNLVEQKLSRKLIHITTAPVFLATWVLYSSAPEAQVVASLVPLANLVRIAANGLGALKDKSFVKSMSREGSSTELLTGPLFYTMSLFIVTAFLWRTSVASFAVVGMMAGGDGMADVVGRRFGRSKIPYNKSKTIEGSLALALFGFLMTLGLLGFFHWLGAVSFEGSMQHVCLRLLSISVACAVTESLPLTSKVDDNLVVPVTVLVMILCFYPQLR